MPLADRLSYWALPMIAAAVALVVCSPVLWWQAPLAAVIAGGSAAIVGIPILWVLRRFGADHSLPLATAGGALGGLLWWFAAKGASPFEVLLPIVTGSATGAIYGAVQAGAETSAGLVRTRVVLVLVASVFVVVSGLIWLPARWPSTDEKIITLASWHIGPAVDAGGVREVIIRVADPPCLVSLFLPELESFLVAQPTNEVEVLLSRTRQSMSTQTLVVKRIGDVNVPYPSTQGVVCGQLTS